MRSGRFPRVTTRGLYDIDSGDADGWGSYSLYPKASFGDILSSAEFLVVVHGLRNDRVAALEKFRIARDKLNQIGYRHHVVGFTYDSNVRGAHIKARAERALRVGEKIAQANGLHLAAFVVDARRHNPCVIVRLLGHSLGATVIVSALRRLASDGVSAVESVHLFGASISASALEAEWNIISDAVRDTVTNYYNPDDEVLSGAVELGQLKDPIGLHGAPGWSHPKVRHVRTMPENHRFVSYAEALDAFP